MNYDISANISKFEWHLLQEVRKLRERGYGEIYLEYYKGECVKLKPSPTTAPELLKELQK
jgi:hypothetical protein